jgi:hypothetical protein
MCFIKNFKNRKLQIKFTNIFYNNSFVGSDSISGPGSDLTQTMVIRNEIPKLIAKYNVKTLIDAPCGDFYWMQHMDISNVQYIGVDIVVKLVEDNKRKYENSQRKFICKNIISDILPSTDMILIRDCWVHLSNEDILKSINNLKLSNIKYLLTTSFTNLSTNKELDNIWRPINLELSPFNFAVPIEIINENCTEDNGIYSDKSLLLWEINKLPNY